jgi:hypothetical protein
MVAWATRSRAAIFSQAQTIREIGKIREGDFISGTALNHEEHEGREEAQRVAKIWRPPCWQAPDVIWFHGKSS